MVQCKEQGAIVCGLQLIHDCMSEEGFHWGADYWMMDKSWAISNAVSQVFTGQLTPTSLLSFMCLLHHETILFVLHRLQTVPLQVPLKTGMDVMVEEAL